jgi:hypothetical protein
MTSPVAVTTWCGFRGAEPLLDRLLHRSVVLTLDGGSYRLRDHHARNDTLRATTTGTRQPPPPVGKISEQLWPRSLSGVTPGMMETTFGRPGTPLTTAS